MRAFAVLAAAALLGGAQASRILLVPLDSRPAAGQFAQMIARMADVQVDLPPLELLGRFTKPGEPDALLDWLRNQDFRDVAAVVLSTDMITYGGLISSRVPETSQFRAEQRLERLAIIRKRYPKTQFYGFSAIMRLNPTVTRASKSWHASLGRYMELRDRYARSGNTEFLASMESLRSRIPADRITSYETARARNHAVQRKLIGQAKSGIFDYLILGQDDAKPFGPHIGEQRTLRAMADTLQIAGRVYLCEGIDQMSNVLVSRALLKANTWTPKVRLIFSDPNGKQKVANYESKNISESLRDQLLASGARPMGADGQYDYTLFLNTPEPNTSPFQTFLQELESEVDQGFPVAVADINLGKDGTGDPKLFATLWNKKRMMRLLGYAGWNTAGNTMGTSIPAANVYLLARKLGVDSVKREVAMSEFLLHRYVNDYAYHKYTRPEAYRLIDNLPGATREETYGESFNEVNDFVRRDLSKRLKNYFEDQFLGKTFFAGTQELEFSGINDVNIYLPWPRAYEVRLEFRLETKPAVSTRTSRASQLIHRTRGALSQRW